MPAHDWCQVGRFRICDACDAPQRLDAQRDEWRPAVSSICPGDGRDSSRRKRPTPSSGGERIRELEDVYAALRRSHNPPAAPQMPRVRDLKAAAPPSKMTEHTRQWIALAEALEAERRGDAA